MNSVNISVSSRVICLTLSVACPSLEDILENLQFGSLSYSTSPNFYGSYSSGTIVSFECDMNYRLIGLESRTCEDDMEWSGVLPVCECEYGF